MEERKELILRTIIKEHVRSGQPVGSSILVGKYDLGVSPATVRNEMADLEEAGFIRQPYTSAGRVPTEKAYKLFIKDVAERKLSFEEESILKATLSGRGEENFKQTAKAIAKLSGGAVFWAFHKRDLYYTGISNLLSQPEFSQTDLIYDISSIIDRMDEIIEKHFDRINPGTNIMIGSDNPFSKICSSIMTKFVLGDNQSLFGILGPMRMHYDKNLGFIKYIENKFKIND